MASFDGHHNFSISAVATAPSPATSGTSLVVTAADGTKFPAVPFNAVIWPAGISPTSANAEIVRVTNISTDTFTITRTQESTSARTVIVGDQIMFAVTAKTLTDIETLFPTGTVVGTTDTQSLTNKTLSDEFMGDVWDSQSGMKESVTLLTSTDFLAIEAVEIGSATVLEIPATSSLEIRNYLGSDLASITGKALSDTFQGDVFDNQGPTVRNIILDPKDFLAEETLEIGAQFSLEIPFNSSLEIVTYSTASKTETLRNKTLISPTISSINADSTSDLALSAGTNKLVKTTVLRQDDTTNTYKVGNSVMLTGWGVMTPGAAPSALESVTFGVTFVQAPIVVASYGGDHATSTTYGQGGINIKADAKIACYAQSTTGFTVKISSGDGTSYSAGNTVFYTWTAIGEI